MSAFPSLLIPGLRHLLSQAEWARARLRPHAGLIADIRLPVASVKLQIAEDGQLTEPPREAPPALVLQVPTEALFGLLTGSDSAMKHVRIEGNAEFGEALGFVLRNLEWDREADLAKLLGDIPARRLHQGAQAALAWQRDALGRVTDNLRDYLILEQPTLVAASDLDRFSAELIDLTDQLARLEKRISKMDRAR